MAEVLPPYCTKEDVYGQLPQLANRISDTSRPSIADVDRFCQDATNELNQALLMRGYDLPLAANRVDALDLLRTWASIGAAAKAAAAQMQGKDSKHVELYREDWQAILEMIRTDDRFELPGDDDPDDDPATPDGRGGRIRSSTPADPYFRRDPTMVTGIGRGNSSARVND